ncbi:ribonucleoside-triphosphate reductase activating protein [Fervidicella metallireducens AeB]|uniref:Anaerobic ribonucleoside-triphosphate reductase-activating protein n=1 Tax=Fervidicella metallireducens AeB TaxID=1403537 RepID=A0A017RUQ8_9CLOT|nr:anaerobic ribonucleoside-triphosphate reductase activating protein [Fervidicella metallireducens]EYE88417.1 ribonucleoside-triphosphate reductase activating protein [Fervidicella metallireducens AeB]
MDVRIAGIVKESVVDGPGIRYVIFAQGCKHGCEGCHNPQTHDFNGGYVIDADEILMDIYSKQYIDGVTLSGGDPFFQIDAFQYIAKELKKRGINILVYSGFTFEEIVSDIKKKKLLELTDILIDGPFILKKKTLKLPFRGSENQRIIDVKRSLNKGEVVLFNL